MFHSIFSAKYFNFFLITIFCQLGFSQATNSTLKMDSGKPLRIEYKSISWNKNPNEIDHGWILFRDAGSGHLARIEMQETEVNSGKFVGSYQISFQPDADVLPEIYIAPRKMMESPDQMKKIDSMIKDGTILKKPFFLRQAGKSLQVISVFETREQALQAYQDYKSQQPIVDRAALEAQARQKMALEAQNIAAQEKVQMAERQKLELDEKRKQEELRKKQAEMDSAEIARRKQEAKVLAAEAMALYKKEQYPQAEAKFQKATELDPDNSSAYFPFGVTLYKNEKFNRSLVALKMAKGPDVNPVERDYFMALNHLKLKENDSALAEFAAIKQKDDKALSPAASFFAGVLEFQKENYDSAKSYFEYTMDKSDDPKMDQQAETYIEQIANIKMFQLQKSRKFILGFSWGLMYDSNILNQATANAQTSLNGIRAAYGGSFEYRPVYSETNEFSAILNFNDMYSWDTSFQPKKEFQNTDPLTINLSFPFKYKGKAFDKGYMLTLTPALENMYMNVDDTKSGIGNREQILGSTILKADNMFIMSEDYFASYGIELRSDSSKIDSAAGTDDDQTATKVTLSTSQTHFKDKKKTEASIYDGALALNTANGKNQSYQRLDTGVSYMIPWKDDITANGRVGLFYNKYPTNTSGRTDDGLLLSAGLRKPLNASWAGVLNLSFSKNNSNVDANVYDKYSIMTGVTYNGAF